MDARGPSPRRGPADHNHHRLYCRRLGFCDGSGPRCRVQARNRHRPPTPALGRLPLSGIATAGCRPPDLRTSARYRRPESGCSFARRPVACECTGPPLGRASVYDTTPLYESGGSDVRSSERPSPHGTPRDARPTRQRVRRGHLRRRDRCRTRACPAADARTQPMCRPSTASNPSASTSARTAPLVWMSSPATGSAIRPGLPGAWPFSRRCLE